MIKEKYDRDLTLNIKFDTNGKVLCAKSPTLCKNCPNKYECETITLTHDPYEDLESCIYSMSVMGGDL